MNWNSNNEDFDWSAGKKKIPKLPANESMDALLRRKEADGARQNKGNNKEEIPLIDLHIEKILTPNLMTGLTRADILQLQLEELEKFVLQMQRQKQRRFIVIHGKGSGVLKQEIKKRLRNSVFAAAVMYDAPYRDFGVQGASFIELPALKKK
jgi:hypothetical protein